jgi:peptide/nickel transport system permease protein
MNLARAFLRRLVRMATVVLLVVVGSIVLVRFSPGYLSDAREMDARYAEGARNELSTEAARSASVSGMLRAEARGWLRRDLGVSRQYEVPVVELIRPRLAVTLSLLLKSILLAWIIAGCTAAISNSGRSPVKLPGRLCHLTSTVLLAVPIGAMATMCLLVDSGGPLLVLTTLLAARDFKFLDLMLRKAWHDPHLLHARAQGVPTAQLIRVHLLPGIMPQIGSLATLSLLTALGAMVPVEVIFSAPGIGQLAWNAAMNRDLPVLLAVTVMMAIAVTASGFGTGSRRAMEWQSA